MATQKSTTESIPVLRFLRMLIALFLIAISMACGGHSPTAPAAVPTTMPTITGSSTSPARPTSLERYVGPVSDGGGEQAVLNTPTADAVRVKIRNGQAVKILVIGDSISAMFDPGYGVIAQVRRFVQAKNPESVVDNQSVSGISTVGGMAIVNANRAAYDLAFIPLQVNDYNEGNSVAGFKNRTQYMIDTLKAQGIVPVLVKENDVYAVPEARFHVPYSAYQDAVDELGQQNNLSVVDGYTPFHQAVVAGGGVATCGLFIIEESYVGLHPNESGHAILFQAYAGWFGR